MRKRGIGMKSTFDEFITNNPKQKEKFEKEYEDFLLSEFIIEKMEKASVSPTVIQKLRSSKDAEKITYSTFTAVIKSLGYKVKLEKI